MKQWRHHWRNITSPALNELNIWGHIATVPACACSGTLTKVLPHLNVMSQTQSQYRYRANLSLRYPLIWSITLEFNTTLFNVFGLTCHKNYCPNLSHTRWTLFYNARVVPLSEKQILAESWTCGMWIQWGSNRTINIDGAEAVRVSHNAILVSRMHLATIALLCKQTTDNFRTRHPPEPRWRHLSGSRILFVPISTICSATAISLKTTFSTL